MVSRPWNVRCLRGWTVVAAVSAGSKSFLMPPHPPAPVGEAGLSGMRQKACLSTASMGTQWLVRHGCMACARPPRAFLRTVAGLSSWASPVVSPDLGS